MERLQRILHRDAQQQPAAADVEKSTAGKTNEIAQHSRHSQDGFRLSLLADPAARFTAEEQLHAFRHLIGITNDQSLSHGLGKIVNGNADTAKAHGARAAPNVGLYARVVHNEKVAKDGHKRYSLLISTALGLQLIVAAALTALGAADGSRTAVTIFGAINTVIAGFLTYLKGSGLPSRLKYYQNEWKKLREYIEQRERDFSRAVHGGGPPPADAELMTEVALIERMYMETKTDIEVNTPDGYTSISRASQGRNVFSSSAPPLPHQSQRGLESTTAPYRSPERPELARLSSGSVLQRGSGMSDFSGIASKLQGALGQLEKHGSQNANGGSAGNLAKDLEHLLPPGLTEKLHRLSARVEDDAHYASETVAEASSAATGLATSGAGAAERVVDGAEQATRAAKDDVSRHTLDVVRDLEAHERAVQEARRRVETLAGRVASDVRDGGSGS